MGRRTATPSARSGGTGRLVGCVLALCAGLSVREVRAAGVEEAVNGTVALGRAAAYVRANDFMAVWQNPANLALVPKRDAGAELRLPVFNACFNRDRDPDIDYKPFDSFDKVCNETKLFPTGNLGYAMSFDNGIGFGVGLYTPPGISRLRFGDDTIVTLDQGFPNEQFDFTTTGMQSANRFLLLERDVFAAYLMAGIGWQIIPQLRVGASIGIGMTSIQFKNVASLTGGTFLDQELLADVHVSDWAFPRAVLSVVGTPIPALELMLQATIHGDISADGHMDVRANGIQGAPRGNCRSEDPGTFCRINDVNLTVPYQRAEIYFGARYAQRRPGVERALKLDPMRDEIWDIELNMYWSDTGNVDRYVLTLYDVPSSDPNAARIDFSSDPASSSAPLPRDAIIPHRWRSTYGVRLGGDYNVLRSLLAVRAGLSYESRAMRTPFMNIDYFPMNRVGLHFGATVQFGMLRVTIAYAHMFYERRTVDVGAGRVPEIVAVNRPAAQAVNEGSYKVRADILSFQGNVSF